MTSEIRRITKRLVRESGGFMKNAPVSPSSESSLPVSDVTSAFIDEKQSIVNLGTFLLRPLTGPEIALNFA